MPNPQLTEYITQARKSGISDDQIRQALIQSGWSDRDINEGLLNSPLISPSLFKKVIKFVILFAILAVGYFAVAYYMTLWPFEADIAIPTLSPTPNPSSIVLPDQSSWAPYSNPEYGFEFKYPRLAQDESQKDFWVADSNVLGTNLLYIEVGKTSNSSIASLVVTKENFNFSSQKVIVEEQSNKKINDINWDIVVLKEIGSGKVFTVALVKYNNLFFYTTTQNQQENPILSTFKFTK